MAASVMEVSGNIDEKVFVVTGGAAGVGAGVVRALLAENARHVAFLDIREREGGALEAELSTKFGALRAKFIKCDIADEYQLNSAFTQVIDKYHRLDGVVNNAAVLKTDETQYFKKIIDINFGNRYNAKTKVRVMTVCLGPTDTAILLRNNLEEDVDSAFTSHAAERQRVGSAVAGIIEVIREGQTGTTWMVSDDKPAVDITKNVNESFEVLSKGVKDVLIGP